MDQPDNPSAQVPRQYVTGMGYYCRRLHRQAVAELAHLRTRKDPTGNLARYYEGMSLRAMGLKAMASGRWDEAESHLRSAIKCIGRNADLSDYLAASYACTRRFDRCTRQAETSAELRSDDPAAWRRFAQAQWQSGRRAEAHLTLRQAVRRLDQTAGLYIQIGLFLGAEGDLGGAAGAFTQAIEADCTNGDAHYYLALATLAGGDVVQAAKGLQRALELRPTDLMLAYQLAKVAHAAAERGTTLILRPFDLHPLPGRSQVDQLARYVTVEGDFIEAFLALPRSPVDEELFGLLSGVLEVALADHPDYADLQFHFSRVCQRLGRTLEAIGHADQAVRINPRFIKAQIHLAELYAQNGQAPLATKHLRQAVSAGADWADVHCRLGEILLAAGQPSTARWHLQRAVQLNAGYDRATKALSAMAA